MLLARLVATSAAVTATSKRTAKRDLLAELLADLDADEVEPAVGFLIGSPRQGALGVGWATVAKVVQEELDRPADEPSITVAELDTALTELQATEGEGSNQARRHLLAALLERATADERDYVGRLLTGGLRQGALAGVATDAVASAAGVKLALMRRATMLQGDLPQAARIALVDGADGLAAVDLAVGRPIQPMLASTAADVAEAVGALGRVQVEWKLDGARIQVHRDGDDVAVYTRNLNDVTARLPQIGELVRALDCTSLVLDGEVIGGGMPGDDGDESGEGDGGVAAFQDTMSAFGSDAEAGAAHGLTPFFFDLMFLDGESLVDVELATRSDRLAELVGEHQIPRITTDDADAAAAHLGEALAAGHEGVMVKSVDSVYEAGRRGKTWRKIKPVHTLDLVVLAAEWGHGRRQGWLSNLHLGARHPETGELVMVGKTFKGLTDELLRWQTEEFLARKIGERQGGHTVEVRPELVVEIALDGAQRSTRYPGGVALRFARVRAYRPDRSPADADTLDAVRALL
ncbi:MAG: ATP-dependent DNA ligase [Actinomycetota bacterium]